MFLLTTVQGGDGSPGAAGLPGEKGAQGPTGPAGPSGANGEEGEPGDDGDDGEDGDQGEPVSPPWLSTSYFSYGVHPNIHIKAQNSDMCYMYLYIYTLVRDSKELRVVKATQDHMEIRCV